MAEHPVNQHPVILDNKKQVKILVRNPEQSPKKESVVENKVEVAEPKKTIGQRLSAYAFGEEVAQPGKYIWKGYLEPTGKRVANDIVEHFLLMLKHTFQRWIWNGKTLDDGKWNGDRTSFSMYSKKMEPIKAMVMMSPVKELTFATQADAQSVLNEMKATVEKDQLVTVRQYYEASGHPELVEANGVSSSSGWTNLSKIEVKPKEDGGYYIPLPRPISLSSNS